MYFYGYMQHQPHAFANKLNYKKISNKSKVQYKKEYFIKRKTT